VDETAAAVEWRTVEVSGGLELGPLGRQQDLVDQHRTTVAGGRLNRPGSFHALAVELSLDDRRRPQIENEDRRSWSM
jgi:hypothetical protein